MLRHPNLAAEALCRVLNHPANCQKVYGPCGTIAYTLSKLGWAISASAELQCDTPATIHLLETPWPCVQQQVHLAWMRIVAARIAHRKLMTDVLDISRKNTAGLIAKRDPKQANTAALADTSTAHVRPYAWQAGRLRGQMNDVWEA